MSPGTGERLVRFVGDRVGFTLQGPDGPGWRGMLRTNLGRAAARRREIIDAHAGGATPDGASWHDLPMHKTSAGWQIELPLAETGYFKAKAYLLDGKNWQRWPDGPDAGIAVHPDFARLANTIYCAFTRLFGATKNLASTRDEKTGAQIQPLDGKKFTVIPPSGTFRDLARQLPFIVQELGCRIIQLLPVHPTPTTYARFGRFGSPYAALDLTAVDPALVELDRHATGIDQFCELTWAAHAQGARVFLDMVVNHTGWGSRLQETHPEFFLKKPDGEFASPGAWGTTWEDLVELKQDSLTLWDLVAGALTTWCRRGVDGFRCDAGYKIPVVAWQYIIARVQEEFPETIFLLEGLGGSWETTEALLTEGGMHWAYSELFQNYSGREVAEYLDYANRQSSRVGPYVHFSETHDNHRLAAKTSDEGQVTGDATGAIPVAPAPPALTPNRAWSLLRNRLCGLASPNGGFGFTCGVEWLATEKILVHGCTGLNWGSADNIVPELARLNRVISDHPCFFDGARLTRLSEPGAQVYALLRESAEGRNTVLVLVNTDVKKAGIASLEVSRFRVPPSALQMDLLGQPAPKSSATKEKINIPLGPGAAYCLAATDKLEGLSGEGYRRARAQAAFAVEALNQLAPMESVEPLDWHWLAGQVDRSAKNFLAAASAQAAMGKGARLAGALAEVLAEVEQQKIFPRVVTWTLPDRRRVTLIPANHWLLIEDTVPFRATLETQKGENGKEKECAVHVRSIPAGAVHVACFAPRVAAGEATLRLERCAAAAQKISGAIRFLAGEPGFTAAKPEPSSIVLLTNGRGGMARLRVDLGRVNSKYDCVLGANLHPEFPVDRHVFVKRLRAWVSADGFLSPLDFKNLARFDAGPPAVWDFVANAGDGRTVGIELRAEMLEGKNTTVFCFSRPAESRAGGKPLPADAAVRLTLRFDIEDRNFHWETKRNGGVEQHFATNVHTLEEERRARSNASGPGVGFAFTPAADRQLRVFAGAGTYHPEPEWCENIPHPIEAGRGQAASGDAYSPGWFEIPLPEGARVTLVATAERESWGELSAGERDRLKPELRTFAARLERAAQQFVVRRGDGKTVIAGYPWFLDWGRDTFIACRGLLAAGWVDEVRQILLTFAKFEKDGTLPNAIYGDNASNRDTVDAPLWFAVVCEELLAMDKGRDESGVGRTLYATLGRIAEGYVRGTPNGIRMDADSALVWSPAHFTWMDTDHPAGTPREGYAVEIQALWVRLLRQLERTSSEPGFPVDQTGKWKELADRATVSFEKLFWLQDQGWLADVLLAQAGTRARDGMPSDALRGNCLFAVSLGLVTGERARRCVEAARKYLVVPGGLRSLAPLPVSVPLPVRTDDGWLLNNPVEPYWPRYEGDEDVRRKPAYHNGTAWTWTFPTFCETLLRAWDFSPEAVATARSYLGSVEQLLNEGCLGQLPEILDGDAPHTQRGCDAQAWSATEALRVWKMVGGETPAGVKRGA